MLISKFSDYNQVSRGPQAVPQLIMNEKIAISYVNLLIDVSPPRDTDSPLVK